MDVKTPLQRHTEIMLGELGMNPEEFANEIVKETGKSFSTTNIYNWRDGTTNVMQLSKAKQINEVFPQFPVDWLQGFTEARTIEEKQRIERNAVISREFTKIDCVEGLAKLVGVSVEFESENQYADDNRDYHSTDYCIISNENKSVRIEYDKWDFFLNEVCAYVETRLNLILERGAW